MYKNSYQYGKFVPLFNIQNKESIKNWSFHGSVKKAYDKSCKSFVLVFDHSTKAQIPADPRSQELYLVQPYILLQLMITDKKLFHLERRLIFAAGSAYSHTRDNIIKQPLHARIPCDLIREGIWLNLQFDIQSFVERCFGQINFRSIDAIMIGGACRLRKVMTMKDQMVDNTSLYLEREFGEEVAQVYEETLGDVNYDGEELPGNLNFQINGVDYLNQVVSYDRVVCWGYLMDQIQGGSTNVSGDKKFKPKPAIAFGTRVTNKPILEHQEKLKNALGQAKGQYSPQRAVRGASNEGIIYLQGQGTPPNMQSKMTRESQFYSKSGESSVIRGGQVLRQDNSLNAISFRNHSIQGQQEIQYSSPNTRKAVLPRNISQGGDSNVDFTQYNNSTSMMGHSPNRYDGSPHKSTILSNQTRLTRRQQAQHPQIDDHYLNERIKYLRAQRQIIHQLAEKHGIPNNIKVQELSYITTIPGQHKRRHDSASYLSQDPKLRIKEYHDQVNERRKQIHKKMQEKRKQEELLNPKPEIDKEKRKKKAQQAKAEHEKALQDQANNTGDTARQREDGVNGNFDGWDGEEDDKDEYGEEGNKDSYGEEKEEGNEAEDKEAEGGDDYGDEKGGDEDYSEEKGGDEDEY